MLKIMFCATKIIQKLLFTFEKTVCRHDLVTFISKHPYLKKAALGKGKHCLIPSIMELALTVPVATPVSNGV